MPNLIASNITMRFGNGDSSILAVNGASLSVERGERVSITGKSGCGKTTLLNIIGLIQKPVSGELSVCGEDALRLSDGGRAALRSKRFGYIVQDFALIEEASVFENISIPLYYASPRIRARERRSMAREAAERAGIADLMRRKAQTLSGGQRQRVAIARAIANRPSILLADEPTGSLDAATGEGIIELLFGLASEGASLILVTHDAGFANRCDRRIVMRDGVFE